MSAVGRRLAGAWLLLSVACGGSPPRSETTPESASGDPLEERMRVMSRALRARGWQATEIRGRGFLADGDAATFPLELPPGGCWTLVAIASATVRDLDAALYEPSGDLIAEDVQPDAHPTLQLCTRALPRRLYAHVVTYDGSGPYLYVAFRASDATEFGRAAEVVGGRPGVESAFEPDARIAELERAMLRRGFTDARARRELVLDDGVVVQVAAPLRAGRCITLALFGEPELRAALEVRSERDETLAREHASQAPAVQLCANAAEDARLLIAPERGGVAQLLVFEGVTGDVGGESGLWLGERLAPSAGVSSDGATLEAHALQVDAGRAGELAVQVPRARCVRWEARGSAGVRQVELELDGRRMSGSAPALHRCASGSARVRWWSQGAGRLELRARSLMLPRIELEVAERLLDAGWDGVGEPERIDAALRVAGCEEWIADAPIVIAGELAGRRARVCDIEAMLQSPGYVVRRPVEP